MAKEYLSKIDFEQADYKNALKNVGKRLKILRIQNELSILDLSIITDISTSYISQVENGKASKPTLYLFLQLCQGLDVKPSEVFSVLDNLPPFDFIEKA